MSVRVSPHRSHSLGFGCIARRNLACVLSSPFDLLGLVPVLHTCQAHGQRPTYLFPIQLTHSLLSSSALLRSLPRVPLASLIERVLTPWINNSTGMSRRRLPTIRSQSWPNTDCAMCIDTVAGRTPLTTGGRQMAVMVVLSSMVETDTANTAVCSARASLYSTDRDPHTDLARFQRRDDLHGRQLRR